jgi:preprotein translocase subunit SecG
MITVLLVIHLMLALAMVGVILLQRSEGGVLGMGGGGGGLMSSRAAGNLLTRTTAILAAGFMVTSLVLAILANQRESKPKSILDQQPPAQSQTAPAATPVTPAAPAEPAAPIAR